MGYQNTTLAQLQTALAARYDGQPFWSADQARRAINEGLRIWNAITGMWQSSFAISTIPNDPYLFVDGTLVKSTRVTIGGRRLMPSSLYGFDHGIRNWEGTTTASSGAPTTPRYWAPVGLTVIAIYPADATVLGTATVIDGIRATSILVNAGDFVDLGDEEINTLLGYALHVLSFGKGMEALQKTLPMKVAFFKAAAKRNDVFAASGAYRKIIGIDRSRYQQPIERPPSLEEQTAIAQMEGGK